MGVTRLQLLFASMLWVMCWSGRISNGQGVGLTLNGANIGNNSVVTRTDIGTGSEALLCTTTYSPCCTRTDNPETQWYFPNGSEVMNDASLPYHRTRSTNPGTVRLNRNSDGTTTGIFRCVVPDINNISQSLYVGIYDSGTAPTSPQMFQITAVTTNSLSFSWQEPANPNGDIANYEISCKPLLLGIPMPPNHIAGSTDRMAVLTDLLPGVRYNCSIGARNLAGLSTLVYADVTTMGIAMVRVKVVNATALVVSWDAVSSTQHYTFYYSAFSPELFKVVDELTIVVPSTRTSVVVAIRELTAGVEHQFQVTVSLEVQGEVYESKKSILTKIKFDEAAFHLQMGPVSPCTTWSTDKAETIRTYIHSGIAKAISYHCNRSFPVEFIREGLFRCWKAPDEFSYRSAIVGTVAHNATELVQFLEQWVNLEPVLQVEQFELWVGTTCPVSISSVRLRGEGKCL